MPEEGRKEGSKEGSKEQRKGRRKEVGYRGREEGRKE